MFLTKLIVKNKAGKIHKVRLKFEEKICVDQLRECVGFPSGWEISSVSYINTDRLKGVHNHE